MLPELRGDREQLERLAAELDEHASVIATQVNPLTGSVLVVHEGEMDGIARFARERELFDFDPRQRSSQDDPIAQRLYARASELNDKLRETTGGQIDLPSLAFLFLGGSGVRQVVRGELLPAAVTLLWNAIGVVRSAKPPRAPGARPEAGAARPAKPADGEGSWRARPPQRPAPPDRL